MKISFSIFQKIGLRLVALILCLNMPSLFGQDPILGDKMPPNGWAGVAGVPGGIDQYSKAAVQFCNVRVSIPGSKLVAKGDGVTDDAPAIQAAINACPNGQYIYIPTGNYYIGGTLYREGIYNYDYVQHSYGVIIRGDGPGKTNLLGCGGSGDTIWFNSKSSLLGFSGLTNNTRGSTTVQMYSGAAAILSPGMWVKVQRNDTDAGVYTVPSDDPVPFYYTYTECADQYVKVVSVSGSSVSFFPALNEGYSSDVIGINLSPPQHCGIEDLTIINSNGHSGDNIHFQGGEECWVKNVESVGAVNAHVRLQECGGCEVRECYIHDTYYAPDGSNNGNGGGNSDYGVDLTFHSSSCLVEDNIGVYLRHPWIMESACGQDNVIAYNYSKDPINEGQMQTDYLMDATTHGGEPRYNLVEGNVAPTIRMDTVEGASKYDTIFRNQITRTGLPSTYVACFALDIQRGNYYNNFVSNVYQALPSGFQYPNTPIYRLGSNQDSASWPNYPNGDTANVTSLNLFHGNMDMTTGAIKWDSKVATHTLPNSYYLTKEPSWWDSGDWPAIGSDLTTPNGGNPAMRRYAALSGTLTPSPTLTIDAVNGAVSSSFLVSGDSIEQSGTTPQPTPAPQSTPVQSVSSIAKASPTPQSTPAQGTSSIVKASPSPQPSPAPQDSSSIALTGGRAAYSFTIKDPGYYVISGLVRAPAGGSRSFLVNIDAEPTAPTMIWDITPPSNDFTLRPVTWRGMGTPNAPQFSPKSFALKPGKHTLIIRGLGTGTQLRSIKISMEAAPSKPLPPEDLHVTH